MAETNPRLRKYRDVLESIMDSTMEQFDRFSSPGATSVCRCANCSPGVSGENGEENCSAFHQLGGTFTRLNFEFPSQSDPEYILGSDRTGRTRPAASAQEPGTNGRSTDFQHPQVHHLAQHSSISYSRVPGYEQDMDNFLLPDLWDFSGMDAGPIAPLLAGEPFLPQTMDEFLLRAAQRDRLAFRSSEGWWYNERESRPLLPT
ncbi:uncharacterized protein Z519_00270 [Cladophialophora bantiana CBS 173.52]|uniref:Uncharacterized protein n=1 Tax=Cladophialophora bantiana (strain ATCC 10958 / CBS 173.52 / CDC B-1940 / NIH 8579) TaxID=1442370 RepID=A0A0D2IPB9_CLAB1|nr:uncharacterized protein Z519_00270 [Cladophialophora bantiana CBS 173.52]KIW98609.1 hypothetical protein Z519_00270 [Cladophialophora bantiana CBS 173.52]